MLAQRDSPQETLRRRRRNEDKAYHAPWQRPGFVRDGGNGSHAWVKWGEWNTFLSGLLAADKVAMHSIVGKHLG